MLATLRKLFSLSLPQENAYHAYANIVENARLPFFYAQWEVEDTLDGRFDLVLLHMALVIARFEQENNDASRSFTRYLTEAFIDDMDRNLREMGVTDTGVGKRIQKMAQAFYGRLKAYQDGLQNEALLRQAIHRNIYRERAVSEAALDALTAYTRQTYNALLSQPADLLLKGTAMFQATSPKGEVAA